MLVVNYLWGRGSGWLVGTITYYIKNSLWS